MVNIPDCIIGIDPGANGGLAIWTKKDPVKVVKMRNDLQALNKYFEHLSQVYPGAVVFLEEISIFGSDADTPGKQYRIKKLTDNHAQLKAYLTYHGLQYVPVYPQSWQSFLKLNKKKFDKESEKKKHFKNYAQNCFPEVVATNWNGDALCILQFALSAYTEKPHWISERLRNKKGEDLFS